MQTTQEGRRNANKQKCVQMTEDVKRLFSVLRTMAGRKKPCSPKSGALLRTEAFHLINIVPIDSKNSNGESILAKAAEIGDVETVTHLLQKGAKFDDAGGLAPLLVATCAGKVDVMKVLIDAGANLRAFSTLQPKGDNPAHFLPRENNALYYAVRAENVEAVKLLLSSGLKSYQQAMDTPLHTAAASPAILSELIRHGADVSAVDRYGRPPLHFAASADTAASLEALTILLDHGANIDQTNDVGAVYVEAGQTALHLAVEAGNLPGTLLLLGRGANAAIADIKGNQPLHVAYTVDVTMALLAHGAPVNATNNEGATPLHGKALYFLFIRELLKAGANVNATDAAGDSPLHYCVRRLNLSQATDAAQLLIDNGALVLARNNAGERPSDVAYDKGVRAFLLAAEKAQEDSHSDKRVRLGDL
jgi:ankyrin repeat protein